MCLTTTTTWALYSFCTSIMAQPVPSQPPQNTSNATNIITALGAAFKNQTGDPLSGEKIAQLLLQNMPQLGELCKQGKLNPNQIAQVSVQVLSDTALAVANQSEQLKEYAHRHKNAAAQVRCSGTSCTLVHRLFTTCSLPPLRQPLPRILRRRARVAQARF